MLKWHYSTVRPDERLGICPLFLSRPGGFDSSRVPNRGGGRGGWAQLELTAAYFLM